MKSNSWSAMVAIRQRVQRYQRLQQECIMDRGAEFSSVYFETLLTRYFSYKELEKSQVLR